MVKIPIKTIKDKEHETDAPVAEQEAQADAETPQSESPESPESDDALTADAAEDTADEAVSTQAATEEPAAPADDDATEEPEAETPEPEAEDELDEVTLLQRKIQEQEQQLTEHYEARLRLQAEFDNFKKRKEKELADFRKYANSSLLEDILQVVDDFDRAIAAAEQTHKLEDFLKGVEMIFTKFVDTLQKKGVKEIDAQPGQAFDPAIHEAVTQVPTDEIDEGAIAAVFQKGYYLHDRILRAPKVGVAKPTE